MIWLRNAAIVGAGLGIALVLALLFGDTVAARWLAGFLVIYAVVGTSLLSQLFHWAALPGKRELPAVVGPWGIVLERVGRAFRHEEERRLTLEAELAQVHAAVDRLPDALIVLDRYDHVTWSNNAAAELHGVFGLGRPVHLFIRDPEFLDYLESHDVLRPPPMLALPERPGRVFELRLYPTGDGSRLLITRDVTDQAMLDATRRDFVANVSHEIRTPVTVIGGFAETLLNLQLDDAARREYLETMLRQSQSLQRLVEDLLTLSALEDDSESKTEEVVDIHALIQSLATEARALSKDRHPISVTLDASPLVRAVPTELESAIRNLLSNAVRYTPDGGRVDVEWRTRGDEAWLTVRDAGIGIGADHLPRLTERFYRVDRGRSRETGGTGLGLAIVKHTLQRLGGHLHVESTLGQGSAFSLCLPASRLVAAAAPATPSPDEPADG